MKHLLAIVAAVTAFSAQSTAPPVIAVRAARLIDGRGGAPISPAVVLIRGDRIDAVGSALADLLPAPA